MKKKKQIKALKEAYSHAKASSGAQMPTVALLQARAKAEIERRVRTELIVEPLPIAPETETSAQTASVTEALPENFWRVGVWTVMSAAVLLRFLLLTLKPYHHDEGVNGLFMITLFRDGVYKYDPSNYHGPTLYYFALLSSYIFGLNDFALRFVPVVFGVLTVALVFSLRRYLGTVGTLFAAALVALSPGMTYFSRYFIHEMPLVFFTFAVVICGLKFWENTRPGFFAKAAMSITLFVCLLPIALQTALLFGDEPNAQAVARFVFIIFAAAAAYFLMRRLLEWDEGRPIFPLLASAAAAMTFATKETSFIALGTMLIALASIALWMKISNDQLNGVKNRRHALLAFFGGLIFLLMVFNADVVAGIGWLYDVYFVNAAGQEQPLILLAVIVLSLAAVEIWRRYFTETWRTAASDETTFVEPQNLNYRTFAARLRNAPNAAALMFFSVVLFAYLGIVFFSSFFTNEKGVAAAFEAYNIWSKTGTQDQVTNGLWAYFKWSLQIESPLLIVGALGTLIAFWKAKHRLAMFCGLWAFGLFAAYTIIPYKTPWIAVNFVLPMALVAGYAINELISGAGKWRRAAANSLAALAIGICLYQTIELNFFRYDDEQRPYVYVHSLRSMDELIGEIGRISERAGTGKRATIVITSPEYFPLPWNLHKYKNVGFHGAITQVSNAEIVIGSTAQSAELEKNYAATHRLGGTYTLRPGIDLLLYVRSDLAR